MREITTKIFKYIELTETVRERVRQDYENSMGFIHDCEAFNSLEALSKKFNGTIKDYKIDYSNCTLSTIKFNMPEMQSDEIEFKLTELGEYNPKTLKGLGDCKLTGFCYDEDIIDGFRQAFHNGERDLEKLMQSAFRSWLKAVHSEYEKFYSDQGFAEHSDANNYEYYGDGQLYS